MGRRDVPLDDPRRWVFNRLAAHYVRRPPYPEALVRRLLALAGGSGARVADLGAGTGHLAVPLARGGAGVTAVEPALSMLRALKEAGRGLPLAAVHGAAERTGLAGGGSFDLVLVADALHWIDPERAGAEIARLLAPGGALAVVEARPADTPFMRELGELIAGMNSRARPRPAGALTQLFALATGQRPVSEPFRQEALLDEEALEAHLRSLSYAGPALGEAAFGRMLSSARSLAARSGGATLARDLVLWWARAARPAGPC